MRNNRLVGRTAASGIFHYRDSSGCSNYKVCLFIHSLFTKNVIYHRVLNQNNIINSARNAVHSTSWICKYASAHGGPKGDTSWTIRDYNGGSLIQQGPVAHDIFTRPMQKCHGIYGTLLDQAATIASSNDPRGVTNLSRVPALHRPHQEDGPVFYPNPWYAHCDRCA